MRILQAIQWLFIFLKTRLVGKSIIQDGNFSLVEIINKKTNKSEPGIHFHEAPFTDVVVRILSDGGCEIINEPRFICTDLEWQRLLETKVKEILKSL